MLGRTPYYLVKPRARIYRSILPCIKFDIFRIKPQDKHYILWFYSFCFTITYRFALVFQPFPYGTCSVAPVGPVAPLAPVAPVGPVAPVAPLEPVVPLAPVGPVAPVAPVAPLGPVAPLAPVAPML